MSLYDELKRRKVVRVAVVYAATAFVVLQAADLLAAGLGLPGWVFRAITLVLLLGFPIALVLAWALEVTPDGVRRTGAADSPGPDGPAPALLGRRTLAVVALLVAVGIGLGTGFVLAPRAASGGDGGTPAGEAGPDEASDRSVAVLPFADYSPEGDQAWFSDGLAEEILNALARLPDLRVASRTGSFQFRDQAGDVGVIADSLGVAHILEGSVRRVGDQMRITAQLIRASDDAHLWSQNFDRDASDVIRVQEEIAYEIARTLQTALNPEELERMVSAGTNSVAAYEAYLQSLHFSSRATELEDWALALEAQKALDEARTLDPQFHRAHLAAAALWVNQLEPTSRLRIVTLPYSEREARALEALRAAEASAPDEASRLRAERDRAVLELRLLDALTVAQQIVELGGDGEDWRDLGIRASAIGRYELAREAFREAAARVDEVRLGLSGVAEYYHRVDPEAALELADRWIAEESNDLDDLYQMHRVLLAGGRVEQAAQLAEQYLARSADSGGKMLVRVRQLCAEGRTGEAEAYVASLGDVPTGSPAADPVMRWHMLNYLGRSDEAVDVIRPLDEAGELYALSNFLNYTFFDPRPFPTLSAQFRRNGAIREQTLPIPYQCPAAGA